MTHNCSANQFEVCVNIPGSFVCECGLGFSRNSDLSCQGELCIRIWLFQPCINISYWYHNFSVDINECVTLEPCGVNTMCENSEGSFMCNCNGGYEPMDQFSCKGV